MQARDAEKQGSGEGPVAYLSLFEDGFGETNRVKPNDNVTELVPVLPKDNVTET